MKFCVLSNKERFFLYQSFLYRKQGFDKFTCMLSVILLPTVNVDIFTKDPRCLYDGSFLVLKDSVLKFGVTHSCRYCSNTDLGLQMFKVHDKPVRKMLPLNMVEILY